MPDNNDSSRETEGKRPFIREKVAKPPRTKRQMVFRVFGYVILAVIAGIAAGTTFAVAGPLAERYLMPTAAPTAAPTVTIPTDMDTAGSPMKPSGTAGSPTTPSGPESSGAALSGTDPAKESIEAEFSGTGSAASGSSAAESETSKSSATGSAVTETQTSGTSGAESETMGSSATGSQMTGTSGAESETTESSATGSAVTGSQAAGSPAAEPETTGTSGTESAVTGSQATGTSGAESETMEASAAESAAKDSLAAESSETEEESGTETEPIEDIINEVIGKYSYTADDLNAIYASLRSVVAAANNGIVVVHSVRQELDWFDNPVETAGLYAGAVIAATEQEMMILTQAAAIENADALRVTFADGMEADCTVRQIDGAAGMAVVSVEMAALEDSTRELVAAIPLGNSYLARQGDVVIAVGAPAGAVRSSAYGFISNIVRNVQVPDGVTRLLCADVTADASAGTFLLNTAGEIIGWVTDAYGNESGIAVAMSISDYKTMLEKMSNGLPVPYLGTQVQEVSEAMKESGVPAGIYVSECSAGGPAYNSGILNGDIIVRIGETDVEKIGEYQSQVFGLNVGEPVTVVVQRKGAEEYVEQEYQVNVGAR